MHIYVHMRIFIRSLCLLKLLRLLLFSLLLQSCLAANGGERQYVWLGSHVVRRVHKAAAGETQGAQVQCIGGVDNGAASPGVLAMAGHQAASVAGSKSHHLYGVIAKHSHNGDSDGAWSTGCREGVLLLKIAVLLLFIACDCIGWTLDNSFGLMTVLRVMNSCVSVWFGIYVHAQHLNAAFWPIRCDVRFCLHWDVCSVESWVAT